MNENLKEDKILKVYQKSLNKSNDIILTTIEDHIFYSTKIIEQLERTKKNFKDIMSENLKNYKKRTSREDKILKVYQKSINKSNDIILTIIKDATELDIDKIIHRLERIKETTDILRNSTTIKHQAKFMSGRSSGIGTALDLLNTIKKNNQK